MRYGGEMRRVIGWALGVVMPWAAVAGVTSAVWRVTPNAPIYAGQTYEVALIVETAPGEEVTNVTLDAGPTTSLSGTSAEERDGKRITTFYWEQVHWQPQTIRFPESRAIWTLMVTQRHGFFTSSQSRLQETRLPAFSYDVIDLPAEAKGLPVGDYTMAWAVSPQTMAPGDVVVLTVTVTALAGTLPERLPFTLAQSPMGRLYPFVVEKQTAKTLQAKAYYALAESGGEETLHLSPLRVFDVTSRRVAEVSASPLHLKPLVSLTDETREEDVLLGEAREGDPLRLAPDERSPVVGTLGKDWTVLETYGQWSRLAEGWIRSARLTAPQEKKDAL